MIRYDFKCRDCGLISEFTSTDADNNPCPECGGPTKRLYNFAGSVLKGSGWYRVDKRKTDGGKIGLD